MPHPKYDVVVSIDRDEAKLIRVGEADDLVEHVVEAEPRDVRHRASHAPPVKDLHAFHHAIAKALADAQRVLIVGPDEPRRALVVHLEHHHPAIYAKIYGIEATPRLSDPELAAFARAQFASP